MYNRTPVCKHEQIIFLVVSDWLYKNLHIHIFYIGLQKIQKYHDNFIKI